VRDDQGKQQQQFACKRFQYKENQRKLKHKRIERTKEDQYHVKKEDQHHVKKEDHC